MNVSITQPVLAQLQAQAEAAFPNECCGIIIDRAGTLEVVEVTNIQDELHAQDPEQFPRTAKTAYTMGREAAPVLLASERGDYDLHAIFHSHPQHDAYFSEEDRRQAKGGWDEPMYPHAGQIVLSVYDGKLKATAAFRWSPDAGDYVEVPLEVA